MRPGEEIISEGISDLLEGQETISALVVSIGAPRLRLAGLQLPDNVIIGAEHKLYKKLCETGSNSAHSRYNALIRRLVSFERSLECGT
jgi:hypothetical protein